MMNWTLKSFETLTSAELYAILQLRNEVFIVEQNCPYQDLDEKDQFSQHFCAWNEEGVLVAYTRLIPPGKVYAEISIGRVVTKPIVRKEGIGRILMQKSIDSCYALFGQGPIKIGAQFYLKKFYESLGFVQTSEIYLEDNIEHIEMVKP
jgi:ElaA protein